MEKIKVNSIVQINENSKEGWVACLVQVTEVKEWGITGFVKIPMQGEAHIRLKFSDIDYVGEAVLIHPNTNN